MGIRRPSGSRRAYGYGALSLALLALAGCGGTTSQRSLSLSQVPLVPGAQVVTQLTQCDRGANAYCAVEAVLVDPSVSSSGAFVTEEVHRLHALGWKSSAGDDGVEVADNSPDEKLRLTFATALNDLIGIEEGWIQRGSAIGLELDKVLFDRTPAMSVILEAGAT